MAAKMVGEALLGSVKFVGGALVGSAVEMLLGRLASQVFIDFFRARKHDEGLLKKLELTLLELNKLLNDAENRQLTDLVVRRWLDELKDAIYHAEDLLDEITYEALRSKVGAEYPRGKKRLRDAAISTLTRVFDGGMNSKLEEMIGKLDYFVKAKDVLGLREVVRQNRTPTTSLVDESCVYGRENDKEEIMKLLLSGEESSNKIDVIPIVGMGGLGKTTLAQFLYNDGRVDGHFDKKAWVCVSDIFDILRVTRTIVEAVTGKACDTKDDLNLLHVKLKESLREKKFLVVLDDVWNENKDDWDVLTTPLRCGARGSKIIVTTRDERVAAITRTVPIFGLQGLQEEDCLKLFSKHAFGTEDCNAHRDLEKIGEEIVKRCKGLPLAAKTLGGLLRSTRDVEEWNAILKSEIWDLPEEKSNILPALRLSYHYLPSHLKRCFTYCSLFVKDHEFYEEKLVSTWIAEGFVEKPKNNKTKEEEGRDYFRELLSRSFFQRSNANKICFVMHDLVHDLAQYMAGDFFYRLEDGKLQGNSKKVRHFSYASSTLDGFEKFEEIKDAKYLRTFLALTRPYDLEQRWLSKKVLDEIFPVLTCLRLLSLTSYRIPELPNSIGCLIHLRFLDLSDTLISQLPESVCILYNLETLLLRNCCLLRTLPAKLVKLISLCHLDLSGTNLKEMPMHMSRLKDLQKLTTFVVGKCIGSSISELKELRRLRGTISISKLQNVTSGNNAREAKMKEKTHIEKLALAWGSTTEELEWGYTWEDSQNELEWGSTTEDETDVLENLEPHTNLKHLEIQNYGGTRFPTWLGDQSLCHMVSLHLEDCRSCVCLPSLGQMPSLKELTIVRMPGITNLGREFYGESGSSSKPFESLRTLHIAEMMEWVQWVQLDVGEFSQLQTLRIIGCPNLIGELPKEVPSLVRLEIKKCPKLVASLPRTISIRKLLLEECEGVQLEWQGVSFVEELKMSGSERLKEFASELVTLTSLKKLEVSKCSILSLPQIGFPLKLTSLSVEDCGEMQCFPGGMMCLTNLKDLFVDGCPELGLPLPEETSHCNMSLERLTLQGCESLKSLPLGLFPKLRHLSIKKCINLENLLIPDGIENQNLTLPEETSRCNMSLEWLFLSGCESLRSLPRGLFPKLRNLAIFDCINFETLLIPDGIENQNLTLLESLTFCSCINMVSFPCGGIPAPQLSDLSISYCKKLKALPEQMHTLLPSLQSLKLSGCPDIESLPEGGLPSKLCSLEIKRCNKLVGDRRNWGLQSLRKFSLSDEVVESFPEEGLLPPTLTSLVLSDMPNLTSLNARGLQLLVSLKKMEIWDCPKLQSLPEEGLPTSLYKLWISGCPLLTPRCRWEGGEDWHKVAHVPLIVMDTEAIFDQVYLGTIEPWDIPFI